MLFRIFRQRKIIANGNFEHKLSKWVSIDGCQSKRVLWVDKKSLNIAQHFAKGEQIKVVTNLWPYALQNCSNSWCVLLTASKEMMDLVFTGTAGIGPRSVSLLSVLYNNKQSDEEIEFKLEVSTQFKWITYLDLLQVLGSPSFKYCDILKLL